MGGVGNVKVLFAAGFGPIVRDTGESRKLYGEVLGIPNPKRSRCQSHRRQRDPLSSFQH
jgi:hypothetical protein